MGRRLYYLGLRDFGQGTGILDRSAKKDNENVLVRYKAQQFIEIIKEAEGLKEFNIDIYFKIIEEMIVFEGNKIIITLLDGSEIEVGIE